MLDPIQNHALRLCLGAYRTSPASSLCVEANEPPLYFRRKKPSLQYCLKLSSNYNNPAYATVFNSKFHSIFERKPTQLPPLAMRVSGDLQAVGFKKSDVITKEKMSCTDAAASGPKCGNRLGLGAGCFL